MELGGDPAPCGIDGKPLLDDDSQPDVYARCSGSLHLQPDGDQRLWRPGRHDRIAPGNEPCTSRARLPALPVVVDVAGGQVHYTTEMALTNNTTSTLDISILYTASLGSKQGSGTGTDYLAPGEQKMIGDAISYLRARGLAIPYSEQPQEGGTLLVTFQGSDVIDPRSVRRRPGRRRRRPHPARRARGLASGTQPEESSTSSLDDLRPPLDIGGAKQRRRLQHASDPVTRR